MRDGSTACRSLWCAWLAGCVAAGLGGGSALGQVTATRAAPPARAAAAVQSSGQPAMSEEEIASLRATFESLGPAERTAMIAMYKDMGIDLEALLGLRAGAPGAVVGAPVQSLLMAVQALDFSRTPQKVLGARAELGLRAAPMPGAEEPVTDQAAWLHRSVLAGEWVALGEFLRERGGDDSEAIYAHVVQSTNQGDPMLLPEEVLAIAESCPGEPTKWQLDVLGQLLKSASSRSSTGPLLERLSAGTRLFGHGDEARRERTARLLSLAGLAMEARGFLPPLESARESGDHRAILDHARYHSVRAETLGAGPEGDAERRRAWELFGEVSVMEQAPQEDRRESLRRAIDLLPGIPPGPATAWLGQVFGSPALAPAALEAIALKAMTIKNEKLDEAQRAQAILTMNEAVDALLASESVQIDQLRVPLRMLTLSLVQAAEETIAKRSAQRGVAAETALLLRALPSERWRGAIESSLAVRAFKALVGIAVIADDTDLALDLLAQGVSRAPGQGRELADEFLRLWTVRLNPPPDQNMMMMMMYYGGRYRQPTAPLTRGRQRRDLERLTRLLDLLDGIGVEGRRLERVVEVFGACHGRAETFRRDDVVRVLGPIEELAPGVASRMADAMRSGLAGDWRSRDVQREEGSRRSASEIDALVEEGYDLALELIASASRREPDSWRHAMTRTALAYDRMQFRREREQDAASYNAARADLFRSFSQAASRYRLAVERGEMRADPGVYLTWFSIALGSSDLSSLRADDLLTEGSENLDQLDVIRGEMLAMPAEAAEYHIGEFARRVVEAVPSLAPEVKPGVVRRAVRVVGDSAAGAPLRRLLDLYEDLVKDEIQLRLTLDGPDRVGDRPFGAVLTLRYTASIEREIGGFQQYLQNNVWTFIGNRYESVNMRDRLKKSIEQAFKGDVELVRLGFFDSMNPARPISVEGSGGWEEKPIAYLVLRARDPRVDHVPSLQMDLNFVDSTGPVVLPVRSNTVLVDAAVGGARRPALGLVVTQTLDARQWRADEAAVKLEVTAVGRGVVPDLAELLAGVESALEGFRIGDDGIDGREMEIASVEPARWSSWYYASDDEKKETYVEPDEDGVFRLTTSRTWLVTYRPSGLTSTGSFRLPTLAAGVDGELTADRYVDMDLVPVATALVPLEPHRGGQRVLLLAAAGVVAVGVVAAAIVVRRRRRGVGEGLALRVPDRVTPLSAVVALQRLDREHGDRLGSEGRGRLRAEIAAMERAYFAEDKSPDGEVERTVRRWVSAVREAAGAS